MHGKGWIDGVIDLATVSADARQQDERRQSLPATSSDLISRPFRQNEAISGGIDEIEQCSLSAGRHIGLERCIARTTRKNDNRAESSKRRIRTIVLVGGNRRRRRRKPSRGQGHSQRSRARRTVVSDDQDVFRAYARGVVAHSRAANDATSAAIVGIGERIEFATIGRIAIAIRIARIAARQRAHTTDAGTHAIGRIGTHHAAHATIGFVGIERRFAAVSDHHVAIIESRLTGSDHAHAHIASPRPIGHRRARHSATTTMPDVRFRIRFATIERTAEAIGKTRYATPDAANVASTSGKTIGNCRTYVAASAAMRDRIGEVRFATIGNDAIAIGISSVTTTNHTCGGFAFWISMRNSPANLATHPAIEDVRRKLRFATAPNAIVAIVEPRSTRSDGAYAIGTTRRSIGRRRTRRSTRAAIEGIRAGIDFTPVRLKSVAIGESRQTLAEDARTSDTGRLGIRRRHALIATTTAMVRVVTDVDFAAVRDFPIAISKPLFAIANGAHRVFTTTKCIWRFAFGPASPTILPVFRQIDFAPIEQRVVAISKTSTTRHAACSSIACRTAIDSERTRFIATAAIVDIGRNVRTRVETTRLTRSTRSSRSARFGIDIRARVNCIVRAIEIAETIRSVLARRRTSSDEGCARKSHHETKIVFHREPRRRRAVTTRPNATVAQAPHGVSSFFSATNEHRQPPPPVGSPHVPTLPLEELVVDGPLPPPPPVLELLVVEEPPPTPLDEDDDMEMMQEPSTQT